MAALLISLVGFGATAFGVAVNMPRPAIAPQLLVTELISPLDTAAQFEALAAYRLDFYRVEVTRAGDTVAGLFGRLNIADPAAARFLSTDSASRSLFEGRPGKAVRARVDSTGRLIELVARYDAPDRTRNVSHFSRLRIELVGDRLISIVETAALESRTKVGSGTIVSSLFAATDASGIPETVASQMADVLSGDIDFHRDLRKGDSFAVVYEVMVADGEPVTWIELPGRLVATEFFTQGRKHSAIWYRGVNGKGEYYSFDGQSKRRAFLASPLEFSRVSSGFSNRMHPLLKQWQKHHGVDYAAPSGTPVRCVGDGVVEFSGSKNGYGNVVEVRHSNGRSTLYAHLRRIDVRNGQRVEQGERLGTVGASGWATGPHLHFEFKVGGIARNPARLAQWSETARIGPGSQPHFAAWARGFQGQIELALSTVHNGINIE
ncbi:MAG: M23 family metallopeptidase [Burkholderiaceae bacterium]